MKSLPYRLGGRPRTLADCVDACLRARPLRVTMRPVTTERVTDQRILRQFVCVYRWIFPDGRARCVEVCGGVILPATETAQDSARGWADERLRRRLATLAEAGVSVESRHREFAAAAAEPTMEVSHGV